MPLDCMINAVRERQRLCPGLSSSRAGRPGARRSRVFARGGNRDRVAPSSCIRRRCGETIAALGAPPWPPDLQPCRAAPPARGRLGSGRTRPASASGRWRRGSPCGSPQAAAVQRGGRRGRRVGSSAGRCSWPMMDDPGQWASAFSGVQKGAATGGRSGAARGGVRCHTRRDTYRAPVEAPPSARAVAPCVDAPC